jgi:hypothetical protein
MTATITSVETTRKIPAHRTIHSAGVPPFGVAAGVVVAGVVGTAVEEEEVVGAGNVVLTAVVVGGEFTVKLPLTASTEIE